MPTIEDLCRDLAEEAPLALAEDWDNVGLLVGDPTRNVERVMTCLTVTPETTDEAVARQADLIVTHHPIPFRAVKRLTPATVTGRLLLQLAEARVAVYSAHTAYDSAATGINAQLADGLGLANITPLRPADELDTALDGPSQATSPRVGTGRVGSLPTDTTVGSLVDEVKTLLGVERVQVVGPSESPIARLAIACGSAGELVEDAVAARCDAMLLGETRFHTCLEAEAAGLALILPGHYASERFAMESLASRLATRFPSLSVWASSTESDPIRVV